MENFNIIEEKENPLFKRKEVQFSVYSEVTPSRAEVIKLISERFSSPIEAIKIKTIKGKFGSKNFTVSTNIYVSEENRNATEPKSKRDEMAKPVSESEQAPSETKTEEVPKEEVKSEEQAPAKENKEETKPEEKSNE